MFTQVSTPLSGTGGWKERVIQFKDIRDEKANLYSEDKTNMQISKYTEQCTDNETIKRKSSCCTYGIEKYEQVFIRRIFNYCRVGYLGIVRNRIDTTAISTVSASNAS